MASFARNSGQYRELGDVLIIPTDCVSQWYTKFVNKHKLEPYFWLRRDLRPQTHSH